MAVQDLTRIEERIDRAAAGAITVSDAMGGLMFQNMMELMEFAKLVSVSGAAVPSHLRGNPGACLAICVQALEWKMSPFAVANKSYLVNNRGEERIAYESQLTHAVIESRAPIRGRLRYEIVGEGDERRCKVWGTFKNEDEPHVYISETLGKLRDARGRNDYGKLKGSPLWESQPEVQLFYSASRQWCRIYAPDTLLGIYTQEELDEPVGPDRAKDVTPEKPSIGERLKSKGQRGFDQEHVSREIGEKASTKTAETTTSKPAGETQQANTGGADENVNASHSGTDAATKESAAIDEAKKSGASAPQDGGDKPQKQSNADAGADAPNEERGSPDKNAKTSDGGKQPSTDFEQADDVIETEGDLVDASARGEAETAMPGSAGSASTSQESDSSSSSGSAVSAGDKGRAGATPDAGASSQQPSGKSSVFQKYADKMNAAKSVDGLNGLKGAHRKFRDTEIWPDENQKRQVLGKIFSTCEGRLNEKISAKDARETLIELIGEGEQLP